MAVDPREQATAALRQTNPELFKTREQISQDAQAAARQRGLTGARFARYVSTEVNNNQRIMENMRQTLISERAPIYEAQAAKYEAGVAAEKAASDKQAKIAADAAANKAAQEADTKASSAGSNLYLTKEQKAQLSQAEATLQAKFISDPQYQGAFQQISDYISQIGSLPTAEQQSVHTDMQEIANALVDTPFDRAVQVERDSLTRKIRQLNETYGELDKSEQLKLETAVQNLDINAAKDLNQNFDDIFSRAGTNSGLLRRIADQIIETQQVGEDQAKKTKEQRLESAKLALQQDTENAKATTDESIFGIEQKKTAAESISLSDLVNDAEQMSLLQAEAAGTGNVQEPQTTGATTLSTIRSTTSSGVDRVGNTQAAPKGAIVDTDAAARAERLGLVAGKTPITAIREPLPVQTPKASASTLAIRNPTTGQTYTGAAAARLQARLASQR